MFDAYNRFLNALKRNQKTVILYLGDFDPSGVDMIRDIRDRITEFMFGSEEAMQIFDERTTDPDDDAEFSELGNALYQYVRDSEWGP